MKVSPSTISVFMHTQRERSRCESQCLACDAVLLKSAPNVTTYLARGLSHPVTAFAEHLMTDITNMICNNKITCINSYINILEDTANKQTRLSYIFS